ALSGSGMSSDAKNPTTGPQAQSDAERGIQWSFRTTENAVVLCDRAHRLLCANPSAQALVERALPGRGAGGLLELLPAEAWEQARASGRWTGEITMPSGVVLKIVVRSGEAD